MIENFVVFTKGGLVVWSASKIVPGGPIDQTIKSVLIEERSGENYHNVDQFIVKWSFANDLGLTFMVIYEKIFQLPYMEKLLDVVKERFLTFLHEQRSGYPVPKDKFVFEYNSILSDVQRDYGKQKLEKPRTWDEVSKTKGIEAKKSKKKKKKSKSDALLETAEAGVPEQDPEEDEEEEKEEREQDQELGQENEEDRALEAGDPNKINYEKMNERLAQLQLMRSNSSKAGIRGKKVPIAPRRGASQKITPSASLPAIVPSERKKKAPREWIGGDNKVNAKAMEQLDRSVKEPASPAKEADKVQNFGKIDLEMKEEPKAVESTASKITSWFSKLTNRTLTKEDLKPVISQFKDHLKSKNVASEIAEKLCESVQVSLEGKSMSSFSYVKTAVQEALSSSLERILTPKRSIDLLRDIEIANEREGRPYSIVFVGVNGVGKSTNLAKVCYWLKENGKKVGIVACDTFRSGAVEQLGVHASRLDVPLFQRGYGQDAAAIAAEGIRDAKDNGYNVVLVDTAGRMQDNEKLMRALAKLVAINNPDLVLFVGEALVGNDGIDQLTKFNQALANFSELKTPRLIDGIILTKFDTIDDKVGAALSMVYSSGAPIVFLGTGQHYNCLKKMNVQNVVNALLR